MLKTRLTLSVLAGGALTLGALLPAAAEPASSAQELSSREHKDLAKLIQEYLDPKSDAEDKADVKEDLLKALGKIGKKQVEKGEDPIQGALALGADLGVALQQANPLKSKRGGNAYEAEIEFREETLTYKVWVPSKYKHSGDPLPLLICLPGLGDEGGPMAPGQFLTEQWTETEARDGALIAAIGMPEALDAWTLSTDESGKAGGIACVLLAMRDLRDTYAIDANRTYLVGRGAGAEAAVAIGGMYPHLFAGVAAQAGDVGETGWGNFRNLPTFFQGGGAQATAFEAGVAEEFKNCTLQPEASPDDIWAWMQDNPRISNPTKVTLVPGRPIPNKAYWLEIPPIAADGELQLTGEIDRESNTVTVSVTGSGATTVTLYFNDELVDLDKPIKLVLNGVEQEAVVPRSLDDLLSLIVRGTSDPGKLYVAKGTYDLP